MCVCLDHFTGIQAGGSMKPPGSKVLGLLWGKQNGLEVYSTYLLSSLRNQIRTIVTSRFYLRSF